jgi:hypothetical protein
MPARNRRILRLALWMTGAGASGLFLVGPAQADTAQADTAQASTVVTVRMPNCNGCTITAVSSVHPGWGAIDDSRILSRKATVRRSVARLHVPTSRTRGLAFAINAGKYNAGNAVPMVVMRYAGMPAGTRVSPGQSAAAGTGSFCWAGTQSRRATLMFASHRSINRDALPTSQERYLIRVWSSTGRQTLRDDLNMHTTWGGGIGIQQGPYCFDDQPATVQQRAIPAGRTYLKTPTPPGTEHLIGVVRRGASVRYAFLPSAGTAGCFRGTFAGGQLLGDSVSLYESGLIWDQTPQQLQVGRRTWTLNGQKWRVIRGGKKYSGSLRKALDATLKRCGAVTWPAVGAVVPETPPNTGPLPPAQPTPTPAPTGTPTPPPSPTPPPPPPSATIVVNTCNTYNDCDYWNPIWVHANPAVSSHIADVGRGTALTARCWANGIRLTDGSNQTAEDDARQFTSSLWYGIDWNGGRGYVPAVWSTKREDHLGLPGC